MAAGAELSVDGGQELVNPRLVGTDKAGVVGVVDLWGSCIADEEGACAVKGFRRSGGVVLRLDRENADECRAPRGGQTPTVQMSPERSSACRSPFPRFATASSICPSSRRS